MTKTILTILCGAAFAMSAHAQAYSQPVREVEKEARSAVRGNCTVSLDPGYSGNHGDCQMADLSQQLGSTVPAGKILVVEDISASCAKSSQDLPLTLLFRSTADWKPVLLQLVRTLSNGRQIWQASQPAKMYAKAGEKLYVGMDADSNVTQLTNCSVRFHGHLVNAN